MRVARASIYLRNILELLGRSNFMTICCFFSFKWWKVVYVAELVFFIVKIFAKESSRKGFFKGGFIVYENIS